MSRRVFTDKGVMAKKQYRCDACDQWLMAGYTVADCETDEQRERVKAAEADKWQILPGQQYRKQTGIYDGEFYTYRGRIDMDSVTCDLEMWDDY